MVRIKKKTFRVNKSQLITIPAAILDAYNIDVGDTLFMELTAIQKPGDVVVEVG